MGRDSINQAELAKIMKVTPVTVSQWITGKTEPKLANLQILSDFFDVDFGWLCTGLHQSCVKLNSDSPCVSIPYYNDVVASAGTGRVTFNEEFVSIDTNVIPLSKARNSVCIRVGGNSMEPVLYDGSIIIIDLKDTNIRDGDMYVFRQADAIRVKAAAYCSTGVIFKSYNSEYKDELYTFPSLKDIEILGRVIYHSSALL